MIMSNELLNNILGEIANERVRQNDKWGEQNHKPVEWIAILTEEVGEAAKEAIENHFEYPNNEGLTNYRKELVQVAAVAVQMIECFDRNLKTNE